MLNRSRFEEKHLPLPIVGMRYHEHRQSSASDVGVPRRVGRGDMRGDLTGSDYVHMVLGGIQPGLPQSSWSRSRVRLWEFRPEVPSLEGDVLPGLSSGSCFEYDSHCAKEGGVVSGPAVHDDGVQP